MRELEEQIAAGNATQRLRDKRWRRKPFSAALVRSSSAELGDSQSGAGDFLDVRVPARVPNRSARP